ncbi:MAG TPA: single-stranded-DNA-specific exonuclease RecJ [Nitrospiraceae bacterium]|jgi:single-stranded-DNA-specific exonuclease|nr:single-stranded-DNA-specific exonuclease RecJ [Nitrospiraceae bacterium]
MRQKRWVVRDVCQTQRAALAHALSISPVTASVLLARGVTTPQEASRWLSSRVQAPHDPFLLPDMERVVDRLHRAAVNGERVCFYGDYDVDGIVATSLYLTFFQSLGGAALVYIPHRLREGYGLNEPALHRLRQEGIGLVVTSDCGTTAHREIATARALGLDIIVTDHHQTDGAMPPALAVLNPHRNDSCYPFKGLCSGALAWKVAQAYGWKYGGSDTALESMMDLVALSTVADVVPLQDENRGFVREGLAQMTRGARCGIRALKLVAGIDRDCTADIVAFRLAPRVNAAGRLAHALTSVRLLTTQSELEAKQLAEELERLNRERQQIEERMMAEAMALVDETTDRPALVLASPNWHLGVVGIVAARLVERFHRPAIVIAMDRRGVGKGSARTVPGFDLYQALAACRDLLDGFGGHPSAAGLTIREAHLSAFRERFCELVADWLGNEPQHPALHVDAEVQLNDVDVRLVRELGSLHPFGAGNPEPTLAVRNLAILDARVVGEGHLKLTVRQGTSFPFDSIGFRMGSLADLGLSPRQPVDLAFVPELNRWNGLDRIQLRIRDLRASQTM